jgi:ABC-type transport system involved in Fe-S cluster assembly fused permease/ATPase subunit
VKYFGGEEHEGARYRSAVQEYQALEYKVISMFRRSFLSIEQSSRNISVIVSLNILNMVQNFIIVNVDHIMLRLYLTFLS